MIVSFRNRQTEEIYHDERRRSKKALRTLPAELWDGAYRKMAALDAATRLNDLSRFGLEKLTKDRKGHYWIRINDQYRICFEWTDSGPCEVEITDYH